MKYHIITFGCQMNHSDSERIATVLELAGLSPASAMASADLLIINSCSVRQSAINRIFGLLNNLKKARRKNKIRNIKTILTGCVLDADKKKLADKFDLIIDIKELTQKPKILINFLSLQNQEFKAFDYTDYFKINPQYRSKFSAYIPIMTGCNNFCAYCAVPYTRGREVSRPTAEIIGEIKTLIRKGYKEITLLGQNVNSYNSKITNYKLSASGGSARSGQITNKSQNTKSKQISLSLKNECTVSPFAKGARGISAQTKIKKIDFPQLLKLINDIPGDFWIRFLTSHPKDMSDKLIKTMVKCKKATEYIHLPIQSGNNEILNKMNRHYTQKHYLGLIEKIREAYPYCHCKKQQKERSHASGRSAEGGQSRVSRNKHGIAARSAYRQIARNDKSDVWQPPIAISTDIIVGFPGETKKQFQNTAKLMRYVKFDMAYLSEYSPRAGTAAAKMPDTVSMAEKKQRKEFLNEVLRKTALANNKKYIGKTMEVLIEKTDTDFFYGKTRTFKNVKISIPADVNDSTSSVIARSQQSDACLPAGRKQSRVNLNKSRDCHAFRLLDEKLAMTNIKPGQFALIKITQARAWGLEGQIV